MNAYRAPRRPRPRSTIVFWLMAGGGAAYIGLVHGDVLPKCLLAGCLLGAWLVRTPATAGDPAATRWLARSRLAPAVMTLAGGWFLFLTNASVALKWDVSAVLLPPMIVLALLGGRRR